MVSEEELLIPKIQHKVIIAGLDSAGKTSIYEKVIEGTNPEELRDLPPTKGIERRRRSLDGIEIVFWDLAGQSSYRSNYLANPQIFLNTSILIYVIDIQDPHRFDESLEYFLQILMTIKNFDNPPRVFSLLHKYDPENVQELKSRLFEASSMVREVNRIPTLSVKNYSTSIYSDTMELIFGKMIQELIPNYIITSKSIADQSRSSAVGSTEAVISEPFQKQPENQVLQQNTEPTSKQVLSEISISTESEGSVDMNELKIQLFSQLERAEEISSNPNYDQAIRKSVNYTEFHQKLAEVINLDTSTSIEKTISQIVDPLMASLTDQIETKEKFAIEKGLLRDIEIELLDRFKSFMELLKSDLWSCVEDLDLNTYEIEPKLPVLFESFTKRIINGATINGMITTEERSILHQTISKLTFQV